MTTAPRRRKYKELLALLLFSAACAVSANTGRPASAVALAAEQGDLPGVQKLLQQGANINERNSQGFDSLAFAIINEHPQIASYLLENGANPNSANNSGITALILAATVGNTEIVKMLRDRGASIDAANRDGITPLMAAAGSDNQETAILLLSYGADPCAKNKNQLNARQVAEQWRGVVETQRAIDANKMLAGITCLREPQK